MSSREEATLPATRPKSRKSLAHIPSRTMDQENMTTDFTALANGKRSTAIEKPSRKSRSKSIGPGGLHALKDTSGNRRKSLATVPHPPPKSILKPTMPPLREIPAHISARKGSPKKTTPPSAQKSDNLIDFDIGPTPKATITGTDSLPNPFNVDGNPPYNETRVTLRTEEEQEAAAREREDKERKELEKEVISRRDARRKSLANRRVSFAPEATLHTWDVVVEYQDSTTSSNATNSTSRASSVSENSVASPHPQVPGTPTSDPSEPPSTPPEQVEDTVAASPAHQRDLHQKKRRRSSGIPPMNFNNLDDEAFSSSPFSGDSVGEGDELVEDNDDSNSNSDSDDADETAMSIDGAETTDMSMASIKSASSTGSNTRLDEALRQAARQAGTQGIEFDENGEEVIEEEDEVVASFAPWTKPMSVNNLESQQDQENVNPFSASFRAGAPQPKAEESDGEDITMDMTRPIGGIIPGQSPNDDEMSMDVTRAFGGIITNDASNAPPKTKRKSVAPNRRQSTRRKSLSEDSSMGDETMDFTMAVGGIQKPNQEVTSDDEEMTMEFTSVVGGVLAQGNPQVKNRRTSMPAGKKHQKKRNRESIDSNLEDGTMDMTVAVGGIMPSVNESFQNELDATIGMEMTTALGGILQPQRSTGSRAQAKKIMELETDAGSSPFQAEVMLSSPKPLAPIHTVASETGSPSMAVFRGKGLRRSTEARRSITPKSKIGSNNNTPVKKPTTPSKQATPQQVRPTTPSKTPPSKNVVVRSTSPKRLFKEETKATSSTPQSAKSKKAMTPNKLFQKDKTTGNATPSFVLTPQPRRTSGVGLDREGLGSPRIAALLDRRGSIGEQARSFVPSQTDDISRGIRFQDPRAIEGQIDREREQEEDRENGRRILEREADQAEEEKDATLNLKEMIQSLTPKKNPLKGRKSLHVGAAKGILGKRPAELDEDDEDEDEGGMKRLKGHQGSPVKNVRLQGPPSKAETTTGRLTRAARKSLEEINNNATAPTASSPIKFKVTTPRGQGRFKDAEANATGQQVGSLAEKEPIEDPEINGESFEDERIQLQDFLNMTSIRFMELNTTKRRHTMATKSSADSKGPKDEDAKVSLEDCVAAGAATIPMLELFQHACHELKSYISEGRKTVREIETETFEENPPLFREYISATPDMKVVMDNQLKNVKTHARLLSKEMWYDWRMTLLGTLKEGLFKTSEAMSSDEKVLDHQQRLLSSVLPKLIQKAEALKTEEADLQSAAEDLANCDPEELSNSRQALITIDVDIEAKKRAIYELQKQLEGKEAEIESGIAKKQVWLEEIREAEKIREECRGWTSSEISSLKDTLEREFGWTITGVSGTTTSMTYQKDIELVFDAASFLSGSTGSSSKPSANTRIDLWYIGANRELNPRPLTPEKDFFLQSIRDHVRGLPQAQTPVKDLLRAVSNSWNKASAVVDNIRLLQVSCPTDVAKTSDNSILIKSTLLIGPLTTKVEVAFHLSSHSGDDGIDVEISPSAAVVYGERFNEPKMGEFLVNRIGNVVEERMKSTKASWGAAVAELGEKLLARGRK
ncbi:hypothetical protein G7Y89_g4371 [Cudoniella acicularis]|uniref:Spc7 kinetochore protein domain-containing protein n=1 Tax=Cudoniella acicularis TaxID=354080 RepID=A0A8H4W7I7_9HELO|nr:hypothetical protein G7Y89_g4371 [Cudoniella acicularis]